MDEIAKKPDAEEYWKELVSDCRHRIEGSMPNPYPFKLLKIVEAPASFLYEYAFDNNVQPEMAFFVERMLDDEQKPDDPSSFDLEEMSVQENLIDDLPNFLKNIHVKRLFTDFHWSVASDKFAGIEMLFAKIATPLLDSRTLYPSALQEISEQGLERLHPGRARLGVPESNRSENLPVIGLLDDNHRLEIIERLHSRVLREYPFPGNGF